MVVTTHSDDLDKLRMQVKRQGDVVRKLKEESASELDIKKAISELKTFKKVLEEKELQLLPKDPQFDRVKLEDLLKQKFFYDQAFSIYGGIQGLYDYGPMGCAMKANLLQAWRQFFILNDHLLEVDCSMLTPEPVLQASGHVERFTDWMVKDVKTGECFRADHLIKGALEALAKQKKTSEAQKEEIEQILTQLDNYSGDELNAVIHKFHLKSPNTQNDLTEAQRFNLMFSTMIGPTGQCKGYLRPETAQGIFVNFQRLLQFNQGRLPFGAAQIGSAFRNEISPRSGLIRVREFCMAEIEYFVDPTNKNHPKFEDVSAVEMSLYSSNDQMDGNKPRRITIGDAVEEKIVANQTLGYFMARIQLFLIHIGVDPSRLRFRQHLGNEMAHYACDCWDAECLTSYGWIECVGCADRSCYDLTQHTKATGSRLVAEKPLPQPRTVQVCDCIPNKGALGKAFKADAKSITERLSSLSLNEARSLKKQAEDSGKISLDVGNKSFTLESSMIQFKEHEDVVHVEEIVPNVIEPSFGIGRILYTVFEHSFRVREGDEQRTYLSVPPVLAPYKCSVLPLSNHPDFIPIVKHLSTALTQCNVSHRIDESSGSIGRRYARTDQIAIPFGITIDFDTINKSPTTATLRDRDSMAQIRVPLDQLPTLVSDLSNGLMTWDEARDKFPAFVQQETVPESQKDHADTNIPVQNTDESHDQSLPAKPEDPDLDVWSSAAEEFPELGKSHESLGPQPSNDHDSKTQPDNTKALSWTSWGKAIRKRYQEEEEREKKLQKHNQKPATEHEELKSTNSGYEADQEDNGGQRSLLNTLSSPESTDQPTLTEESSKKPEDECPNLESQPSTQTETPHHGVFVGDGWPGMKPKSQPNTNTCMVKGARNLSTQPKHEAKESEPHLVEQGLGGSTTAQAKSCFKFDCESLDSEMRQLIESNAQLEHFPLSSNAQVVQVSELENPQPKETPYHGLFTGSGWPAAKQDEKAKTISKIEKDNLPAPAKSSPSSSPKLTPSPVPPASHHHEPKEKGKHSPLPNPEEHEQHEHQQQAEPNNWSSAVSHMNDLMLDSEQWQLQWAQPVDGIKFGPTDTATDHPSPTVQNIADPERAISPSIPAQTPAKTPPVPEPKLDTHSSQEEAPPKLCTPSPTGEQEEIKPVQEVAAPAAALKPVSPVPKEDHRAQESPKPAAADAAAAAATTTTTPSPTPPTAHEESTAGASALEPDTSAQAKGAAQSPEPSTDTLKKKNKKRKPKKKTH